MKVVYIAGPFRGPDHWVIAQNIREAETLALEVWRMGCAAICPHANTAHFQGAASDAVWLAGDLELLRRCDIVLTTPRWSHSQGATAEVQFALDRNIPVLHSLPELRSWISRY